MPALSSPRTRRRLVWLAGVVAVLAIGAGVIALLPRHGGPGATTFNGSPPGNPFGTTTGGPSAQQQAADAVAARAAAKAVRPRAESFMADVVLRKNLAKAHALLDPELRAKYRLSDWQAGKHLPVSVDPTKGYSISTVLSFSGVKTAGFVSAVDEPQVSSETTLVAVRFAKQRGHWLVDYINQGHSSRLVDQTNYAPAGFLPGSHAQSKKDWLILLLGFLGFVAIVVLLDRLLGGGRPAEV